MSYPATFTQLRRHPRAQLRLPARIRWRGPLGMRLEITKTHDVSRDGLLVQRAEPCVVGSRIWVAFPFDPATAATGQPETPARVVRVENDPAGGCRVALHLEVPPRDQPRPIGGERRASSRLPFALPIFVRPIGSPWPEESMTQDVSHHGARFLTARIFAACDPVLASVAWGDWAAAGEIAARVVRVKIHEDSPGIAPVADPEAGMSAILTTVAIRWEKPPKS
jgi:hypothetical protein